MINASVYVRQISRAATATAVRVVALFAILFFPVYAAGAQTDPTPEAVSPNQVNASPQTAVSSVDQELARAKTLLSQQKNEDALAVLYKIFADAKGPQAVEVARIVFDSDSKLTRLIAALESRVSGENDVRTRIELASMLGRLYIAKRDYASAQRSFALGGSEPGLMLASARLLLLLGQAEESQKLLDLLTTVSDPSLKEAVAMTRAWKLWAGGNTEAAKKALSGYESNPAAMYLLYLVAVSRNDTKDALSQSDLLRSRFPHSLYTSMLDDDTIHADPTLAILLGIETRPDSTSQTTTTASSEGAPRGIQVGYFKAKENADKLSATLKGKGFSVQVEQDIQGGLRFLVLVLLKAGQDPQTLMSQLKDQGFEGFLVF